MHTVAAAAAPEIDRLVLSVNAARDQRRVDAAAAGVGLDDAGLLGHWWDFLLAGTLTQRVAELRSRYRPPGEVSASIQHLLDSGLLRLDGNALAATDRLRPLLDVIRDETADRARSAWAGHPEAVEVASLGADQLAAAMTSDHVVAAVHAAAPRPADPFAGLYSRLLTVRYIRQHDHAAAWETHGLTAPQMRAFSTMWEGGTVPADTPALDELVDRRLARPDGTALTEEGRTVREAIEQDTLRRAATTYDTLPAEGKPFLAALQDLPSGAPHGTTTA